MLPTSLRPCVGGLTLAQNPNSMFDSSEVAFDTGLIVHVARRPSERSQLSADGVPVVEVLVTSFAIDPGAHFITCSSLHFSCSVSTQSLQPNWCSKVVNCARGCVHSCFGGTNAPIGGVEAHRRVCCCLLHLALGDDVSPKHCDGVNRPCRVPAPVATVCHYHRAGWEPFIAGCEFILTAARALAATGSTVQVIPSVLQAEPVCICCGAFLQPETSGTCLSGSIYAKLTWGKDGAEMVASPTSVIVSLWKLHPQNTIVCEAAYSALHNCIRDAPRDSELVASADALVSAGGIELLLAGVQAHGAVDLAIPLMQTDLLLCISSVSGEYCEMLCNAGALAALKESRDALSGVAVLERLQLLSAVLDASSGG